MQILVLRSIEWNSINVSITCSISSLRVECDVFVVLFDNSITLKVRGIDFDVEGVVMIRAYKECISLDERLYLFEI